MQWTANIAVPTLWEGFWFALTSFKQLKVGGPEAVLNRYSCAPAAVEDLEAAPNDRAP
jgi:hypothetical protein